MDDQAIENIIVKKGGARVGIILPAAGSGERLGGATPKQYIDILGRPIFLYAVEKLISIEWVAYVILAADDISKMEKLVSNTHSTKISITKGGPTRHASIKAALKLLPVDCEIVLVHDAVRPIIPEETLKQLVQAAEVYGAAGPTRPLISTVVQADGNGLLKNTLVRAHYLNSETPQAFQIKILKEAYEKISVDEELCGTECLQLVSEHCNIRAKLIPGPEDLWKVTIPRDLHSCEGTLSALECHLSILNMCNCNRDKWAEIMQELSRSLAWRAASITAIQEVLQPGDPKLEFVKKTSNRHIIFVPFENLNDTLENFLTFDGLKVFILYRVSAEKAQELFREAEFYKNNRCAIICIENFESISMLINQLASIIKYPTAFMGQILRA
ncbi:D-ribitol-5-phosphate cytidylyltransferase-like isoform X4 [Neocloeon triangulifer]|uniref:D-ribitol-5-phosphate cytidylyltransferase-like isoform X4 n=1 Tax=Neocloeon triangulifer TaxID=2078957 RepID=UPI00286F14D4|nr:D-ribitol-5-phosphate cytidylyltransferase-like isoform X4 [Neocloeon triangulifer]